MSDLDKQTFRSARCVARQHRELLKQQILWPTAALKHFLLYSSRLNMGLRFLAILCWYLISFKSQAIKGDPVASVHVRVAGYNVSCPFFIDNETYYKY